MTTQTEQTIDLEAIKSRQQATWSSGNYSVIGTTLQIVGETLCEAVDVRAGARVLDVAAGNGNASLAAARRGADVVATDYVEALLDQARRRAEADGLPLETRVADAENLPFEDGSFDFVLSTFGVMFTPNPERAAAELSRACRPGGRIGLANWTPEGFIGQLFKTIGKHLPPPAGVKPPSLWGTADRLNALFGTQAESIAAKPRTFAFRYKSARHWLDLWRTVYGPMHKAFAALSEAGQGQLAIDLLALVERCNAADDGTMVVHAEYLEIVVQKRSA